MILHKLNQKILPEGVIIKNDVFDEDGNVILNSISISGTSLVELSHNMLFHNLKLITDFYKDRFFIFNVIGESYDIYSNTGKRFNLWPYAAPIIDFFKKNNIENKLIFKTNNLSKKYKNINHIPTVFWIGKAQSYIDIDNKNINKHFLLQIRGRNYWRDDLFYWLKSKKLLNNFEYSYASSEPEHPEYKSLENTPIKNESEIEQIKIKEYHNTTFCNIVFESIFSENIVFITEKMDKAFIAKQPFIVFGACGYLKKLKELGFKTFDKWWDESYDEIEDTNQRMKALKKIIIDICKWDTNKCNKIYEDMVDIINHNFKLSNFIKNNHQYSDGGYSNFTYLVNLSKKLK